MYTIIGGDGKEYGPVTAEQVRAWIAGGRANLDSKVKLAGTDEWKRAGDFQEISGSGGFVPASAPPPAAPAGSPAAAAHLDIGSCYERSWALLKANFWPLVGVSLLVYLVSFAAAMVPGAGIIVNLFLNGVLTAGLFNFFLLRIRGRPADVGSAFAGFGPAFVALMVANILVTVFDAVGFVLLILPGIYLCVAYAFTYILALDKGLGFWEAMETSRKTITPHWWKMLGLLLLGVVFMLLGCLCLLVGVFVAMPLIIGAVAYAYEDLVNPR